MIFDENTFGHSHLIVSESITLSPMTDRCERACHKDEDDQIPGGDTGIHLFEACFISYFVYRILLIESPG